MFPVAATTTNGPRAEVDEMLDAVSSSAPKGIDLTNVKADPRGHRACHAGGAPRSAH
jgi:hypothetical protein